LTFSHFLAEVAFQALTSWFEKFSTTNIFVDIIYLYNGKLMKKEPSFFIDISIAPTDNCQGKSIDLKRRQITQSPRQLMWFYSYAIIAYIKDYLLI